MRESQTFLKYTQSVAVETLQRILKCLLTKRFGPLSKTLVDRIHATNDTDRLDAAIEQVAQFGRADDLTL
jgi:hypothetical protein